MAKTILITGASSGIGKASAKLFQAKGWNVIATMRTPEKEEELTQLDNVLVNRLDVLEVDSIERAIAEGIEKFGTIDVVLNNAGYALIGTLESMPREKMMRQFGVNVQGLFDVTQKMLPHFRAKKDGMFINISSIGGQMTFPLMHMYHATKFAVEGFSESLSWEMAQIGVKVKLIEPAGINTDFGTRSIDVQINPELTEYNEFVNGFMGFMQKASTPEALGTPEMVADVIYTAATDGTNTLRYRAGADAEKFLTARKNMTDEEFFGMLKGQMGL